MKPLGSVLAQITESPVYVETSMDILWRQLVATVIFSAIGVLVLALSIWLFARLAPFSVRKEIEEDHNTPLGIVMGAAILGISIIIAAAIVG